MNMFEKYLQYFYKFESSHPKKSLKKSITIATEVSTQQEE